MIGTHQGLAYYTIGPRKGLGVTARKPAHVLKLDAKRNALVVGGAEQLECETFRVHQINYQSGEVPSESFEANVRVRYKAPEVPAVITPTGPTTAEITLSR